MCVCVCERERERGREEGRDRVLGKSHRLIYKLIYSLPPDLMVS